MWSIPKGEPQDREENGWQAAVREFEEELGFRPAMRHPLDLCSVAQTNKIVHAWAVEGDLPKGWRLNSQPFEMEWPPHSGQRRSFPEVDRAEFFDLETARKKILPAQVAFLDRLQQKLASNEDKSKSHALP